MDQRRAIAPEGESERGHEDEEQGNEHEKQGGLDTSAGAHQPPPDKSRPPTTVGVHRYRGLPPLWLPKGGLETERLFVKPISQASDTGSESAPVFFALGITESRPYRTLCK